MARPAPSVTTERIYARLPEHYRVADERLEAGASGYPLLRYLSLLGDLAGQGEEILERIDYDGPSDGGTDTTSELVDPAFADAAWLPWLAQLVGVDLDAGLSDAAKRDAIAFAPAGWRAGTKDAIADAARTVLTGTKYAKVYDHRVSLAAGGTQWDVLVVTRPTETPGGADVLGAIVDKGAKPAGVILHLGAYESSWNVIVQAPARDTWAELEAAAPTWNQLQELGIFG